MNSEIYRAPWVTGYAKTRFEIKGSKPCWVQRRGSPRKIGAKIIHHQTPGAGGPPVTKEGGPPDPRASTAVPTQATQRGIRSRRWIPS